MEEKPAVSGATATPRSTPLGAKLTALATLLVLLLCTLVVVSIETGDGAGAATSDGAGGDGSGPRMRSEAAACTAAGCNRQGICQADGSCLCVPWFTGTLCDEPVSTAFPKAFGSFRLTVVVVHAIVAVALAADFVAYTVWYPETRCSLRSATSVLAIAIACCRGVAVLGIGDLDVTDATPSRMADYTIVAFHGGELLSVAVVFLILLTWHRISCGHNGGKLSRPLILTAAGILVLSAAAAVALMTLNHEFSMEPAIAMTVTGVSDVLGAIVMVGVIPIVAVLATRVVATLRRVAMWASAEQSRMLRRASNTIMTSLFLFMAAAVLRLTLIAVWFFVPKASRGRDNVMALLYLNHVVANPLSTAALGYAVSSCAQSRSCRCSVAGHRAPPGQGRVAKACQVMCFCIQIERGLGGWWWSAEMPRSGSVAPDGTCSDARSTARYRAATDASGNQLERSAYSWPVVSELSHNYGLRDSSAAGANADTTPLLATRAASVSPLPFDAAAQDGLRHDSSASDVWAHPCAV